MKIVVLVKEVPDTYGDRLLDPATGLTDRGASEAVLDEISERALEAALTYADAHRDAEVSVLSMGPASATDNIRRTLAIGAASAVHIVDDCLVGADLGLSAEVLAAALRRSGFDLVITGNRSTDGSGGVIPAMLAELLDVPAVTGLDSVEIADGRVSGRRTGDGVSASIEAELPAVISITERLPEARFPTLKGTMSAKKRPLSTLTLAELGIDPDAGDGGRSIVLAVAERPPRVAGVKIVDTGDAGERLAEFLVGNGLA